ncbi:PREDICTED: uncharacterized protein LOC106811491 [Priapulus caudatus]|uniref:Uncharacterized protein LOC106811491 n=1 Tax=Priapulus caudatus TaxID=37621 RepID=A0ABM1EEJ6_PRICU|nr:PREDICTED: uncharacterized protein LOC106811491 [Priapulus caudatus]
MNLRNDFEQLRRGLDLSDRSMPMAQLYTALQTISITAAELKAQAKAYCFFTLHPTGGLHGHNQRELSGLSEEQCVQACLDASDFFCRSIEFCGVDSCERGKCYLSAQSRDTVPADYDTWAHWDYLHRVCVGTPSPPAPTVTP